MKVLEQEKKNSDNQIFIDYLQEKLDNFHDGQKSLYNFEEKNENMEEHSSYFIYDSDERSDDFI